MNKEILLALIDKDINELSVLNKGFSENDILSPTILRLAKIKAENIVEALTQLSGLQAAPQLAVKAEILPEPGAGAVVAEPVVAPEPEPVPEEPQLPEAETATVFIPGNAADTGWKLLEKDASNDPEKTTVQPVTAGEQSKCSLAEVLNANGHSLNDTLVEKAEPSLANVLSSGKIEDLRQSLSLAERFRFQRELFNGNGEKLNTTLTAINGMKTEEQAQVWLSDFGWSEGNECAEEFRQLVHRRFL